MIYGGLKMVSNDVTVKSKIGLHSKNATKFIECANEFNCNIWVETPEKKINAKSLLGVLSLGIGEGTAFKLIAEGDDEKEAVEKLTLLVAEDFNC